MHRSRIAQDGSKHYIGSYNLNIIYGELSYIMPRKCGLCKKEGHNRTNCENQYYTGEYNYKGERHGKGTYEYKLK